MKRARHLPTVALEVRWRRATAVFGTASAHTTHESRAGRETWRPRVGSAQAWNITALAHREGS
jgi:hypothetical protein